MIENCTVYLPSTEVNFQAVFPGGTSDAAPAHRPTRYEYETPQGPIQLNLKYVENDSQHLEGLTNYIKQLENEQSDIDRAIKQVSKVKMFFGVVLPGPVSFESEAFQSLLFMTEQERGFMFVAESILGADGYIVGPMTYQIDSIPDPDVVNELPADESTHLVATADDAETQLTTRRQASIDELANYGFAVTDPSALGVPNTDGVLRPAKEIASRLFAQMALFMWVAATEDKATSEGIGKWIVNNSLDGYYTEAEWNILQMDRNEANTEHGAQIGWQLESMWALAWVCGFEPVPTFHNGQISGELTRAVLEYIPNLGGTVDGFIETSQIRSTSDVLAKEDLFFCADKAVRNAQLGSQTVPNEFDIERDGGAIRERRHGLNWCLSPDSSWEAIDLDN